MNSSRNENLSSLLHARFYEMGNIDAMEFRLMITYNVFTAQPFKKVKIDMIFQNELLVAPKINEFHVDEIDGMIKTADYIIDRIKLSEDLFFNEIIYICKGGFALGAFYIPVKKKWILFLHLIQEDPKSTLRITPDELIYFK